MLPNVPCAYETDTLDALSTLADQIAERTSVLKTVTGIVKAIDDVKQQGYAIRDDLLPLMDELRESCDKAEALTAKEDWPFPTYDDLLFGV